MMTNKKAQSALEFLTTYGWAFLVILIMIGALGYFGILNPERYLPERCTGTAGLKCNEFQIIGAGQTNFEFTVYLSNQLGNTVNLESIEVTSDKGNVPEGPFVNAAAVNAANAECITSLGGTTDITWVSDTVMSITCNVPTAPTTMGSEGTKQRAGIRLTYTPSGNNLNKTGDIEIYGGIN